MRAGHKTSEVVAISTLGTVAAPTHCHYSAGSPCWHRTAPQLPAPPSPARFSPLASLRLGPGVCAAPWWRTWAFLTSHSRYQSCSNLPFKFVCPHSFLWLLWFQFSLVFLPLLCKSIYASFQAFFSLPFLSRSFSVLSSGEFIHSCFQMPSMCSWSLNLCIQPRQLFRALVS